MTSADKLRELLTTDWQPAVAIQARMADAGFTVDETRTARKRLGVTQAQGGVRFIDGCWRWKLAPRGCPTCGRSWLSAWVQPGGGGDYWSQGRPAPAISTERDDGIPREDEPSAPASPPSQPSRFEFTGQPICSICRKPSATARGERCPWQSYTGQRCPGVMT